MISMWHIILGWIDKGDPKRQVEVLGISHFMTEMTNSKL